MICLCQLVQVKSSHGHKNMGKNFNLDLSIPQDSDMDESLVKNQTLSIRSKDQLNIWSTMLMTTFIIEILGVHALHSFPDHVGHMRHQFSHSTIFDKIPLDSLHCKHIFLPQIARIEFFFFFFTKPGKKQNFLPYQILQTVYATRPLSLL